MQKKTLKEFISSENNKHFLISVCANCDYRSRDYVPLKRPIIYNSIGEQKTTQKKLKNEIRVHV